MQYIQERNARQIKTQQLDGTKIYSQVIWEGKVSRIGEYDIGIKERIIYKKYLFVDRIFSEQILKLEKVCIISI